MERELLFFIITSGALIAGVLIDSWQDKCVVREINKYMKLRTTHAYPTRDNRWKFWGNANKLYDITVMNLTLVIVTGWWWALFWLPIHWWLWWLAHDLTTGWFILGKPLHISSDKISQFFGKAFLQSGILQLGYRLFILYMALTAYFQLSFNISLTPFPW